MRALVLAVVIVAGCGSEKPRMPPGVGPGSAVGSAATTPASDAAAGPAQGCPATFAGASGACDMKIRMACSYPQGTCTCSSQPWCGGAAPPADYYQHTAWQCTPKVRPDGCPGQQPSEGSPCSTDGQSCDYTCACSLVAQCQHGRWHVQNGPCKP